MCNGSDYHPLRSALRRFSAVLRSPASPEAAKWCCKPQWTTMARAEVGLCCCSGLQWPGPRWGCAATGPVASRRYATVSAVEPPDATPCAGRLSPAKCVAQLRKQAGHRLCQMRVRGGRARLWWALAPGPLHLCTAHCQHLCSGKEIWGLVIWGQRAQHCWGAACIATVQLRHVRFVTCLIMMAAVCAPCVMQVEAEDAAQQGCVCKPTAARAQVLSGRPGGNSERREVKKRKQP